MTNNDEDNINSNGHEEPTGLWLAKALFDTDRERLPELTDIPLDQVRPLSMMTTYLKEIEMLCDDIASAQEWYTQNYKKYNKGATDIVDVKSNKEFNLEKVSTLMKEWLYRYYQLRRSIKGEFVRSFTVLAQDQMASQTQEPMSADDLIDRIKMQ